MALQVTEVEPDMSPALNFCHAADCFDNGGDETYCGDGDFTDGCGEDTDSGG